MRKVSIYTIVLAVAAMSAPAYATPRTADEIVSALHAGGEAPTTIRYHGDDASLGPSGLAHTNGDHYDTSYISSGFGSANAAAYQNQWQVMWPAGTPGATSGAIVKGIAACTRAKKIWRRGSNGQMENATAVFADANHDMIDPYTTKTEDGEMNCWCKMTGVHDGASSSVIAPDAENSWVDDFSSSAPWVFNVTYSSAAACAYGCAYYCAYRVRDYASFRSAVLGFRSLGDTTNRPMCGVNLISGYAGDVQFPRSAELKPGKYTVGIASNNGGKWAIRLRNPANHNVVTGEALTTAASSLSQGASAWAVSSDDAAARAGWLFGPDGVRAVFSLDASYIVEIAKIDATGTQQLMLLRGDVELPATYPEPTACITISTKSASDSAFERTKYVLENVIDLAKNVVNRTIEQAAAVNALQTGKQTMPDASATNGTCPNFRQCLLVEGADGKPNWFQIKDPVRDVLVSIKNAGNPNARGTKDGDNWTYYNAYYKGDSAWRRTYADGSSGTYDRGYSSCKSVSGHAYTTDTIYAEPCRNTNDFGNFHTLADGEWAVVYDGTEATGVFQDTTNAQNVAVIYGHAKCTSVQGSYGVAATSAQLTSTGWTTLPVPVGERENGYTAYNDWKQCWCQMTGVGLDGGFTAVSSSAPWVFYDTPGSAADCAYYCAYYCARNVRAIASFRSAVFNTGS